MSDGERTGMENGPYEGPRRTKLGDPVPDLVPDPVPKFEAHMQILNNILVIMRKTTTP